MDNIISDPDPNKISERAFLVPGGKEVKDFIAPLIAFRQVIINVYNEVKDCDLTVIDNEYWCIDQKENGSVDLCFRFYAVSSAVPTVDVIFDNYGGSQPRRKVYLTTRMIPEDKKHPIFFMYVFGKRNWMHLKVLGAFLEKMKVAHDYMEFGEAKFNRFLHVKLEMFMSWLHIISMIVPLAD